jgi:hypothetical protein
MFAQTDPVPASDAVAVQVDRRASIRYPCELDAFCSASSEEDDPHWPAQVLDISTVGLGLLAPRSFAVGDTVTVELHSDDDSLSYSLLAEVVRMAPLSAEVWWLGCAFARPLDADEVQNLL